MNPLYRPSPFGPPSPFGHVITLVRGESPLSTHSLPHSNPFACTRLTHRKSEYCVSSPFAPSRDLSLGDLKFYPNIDAPTHVDIRIKAHKTDRCSAWQHKRLYVPDEPEARKLSAAWHLRELLLRHHQTDPALFTLPSSVPLLRLISGNITYKYLQRRIKAMFADMGEDPTFVSTHSLRIGGATALLAAGASETAVKQAGRWLSSDMPQLYAHASNESVQQFYNRMLSTPTLQANSRHHILGWF